MSRINSLPCSPTGRYLFYVLVIIVIAPLPVLCTYLSQSLLLYVYSRDEHPLVCLPEICTVSLLRPSRDNVRSHVVPPGMTLTCMIHLMISQDRV